MSYTKFKNNWLGKRVDYDGVYGYQCVDLIKQWAKDEYGIRAGAWGNAIDYATKPAGSFTSHFKRVTTPQQGDIVVVSGGKYGHIGLVDKPSSSSVYTLEQNGSTGSGSGTGGNAIRLRWISKSRVAAYYRHKSEKSNSSGGEEMANSSQVKKIYNAVLHRDADAGGLNHYTGKDANEIINSMMGSSEFKNQDRFMKTASKQIEDLKKALKNEQNKPAKTVEKEVEKIVEKIVKVEIPVEKVTVKEVEVIKEVIVRPKWVDQLLDLVNRLLKRGV